MEPREARFLAAASTRMFYNVTIVARWRKHFQGSGYRFLFLNSRKQEVFEYTLIHSFPHTSFQLGVVRAPRSALWRVCGKLNTCVLGHCGIGTQQAYASQGDSLFFWCSAPSRSNRWSNLGLFNRIASPRESEVLFLNCFGQPWENSARRVVVSCGWVRKEQN